MLEKKYFNNLENHVFTNYRHIGTSAKFLLILIFGQILLLCTANTAQAATFTVDRPDDANVSTCTTAPADCTLRGAIAAANAVASDDSIVFDATVFNSFVMIILTGGELRVANNGKLVIFGTGRDNLRVRQITKAGFSALIQVPILPSAI